MSAPDFPAATRRAAFAQVLVCASGCCCGRVDKRKPAVPVDWLKAQWRAHRLNPRVQLTISECLGPCDLVNVVAVLSDDAPIWLGGMVDVEHFAALVEWAVASHAAGALQPLPVLLAPMRFHRFTGPGTSTPHSPTTIAPAPRAGGTSPALSPTLP